MENITQKLLDNSKKYKTVADELKELLGDVRAVTDGEHQVTNGEHQVTNTLERAIRELDNLTEERDELKKAVEFIFDESSGCKDLDRYGGIAQYSFQVNSDIYNKLKNALRL